MSQESLDRFHHDPNPKIFVPGRGDHVVGFEQVKRAVERYDERLVLAKHELTQDWVVFVKVEGGTLYPVIGLGRELPSVEEVERKLYQADTARHGTAILDQVNRRNAEAQKARKAATDEAIGETAEYLEWGYRQEGWHPSPRIFVP